MLLWSIFLIGKRGLVAMSSKGTRGKQGKGSYQLPSKVSGLYLRGSADESCGGSPSQFKSLLAHDEGTGPASPGFGSKATVRMTPNPLSQDNAGAEQPVGVGLPATVSKQWLKARSVMSDAHSKKRGSISGQHPSQEVANPLAGDGPQDDRLGSHLPEKVQVSQPGLKGTAGASVTRIANPLAEMYRGGALSLPEVVQQKTPEERGVAQNPLGANPP